MQKSQDLTNIAKALSAFQKDIENPKNTAENPFYKSKYAPLPDILSLARPLLGKHGLSVIQSPGGDGKNITISTLIMHLSGEWIELDPLTLTAKDATAQGAGSAITYGRRYALAAALGISSEDDDDGSHATGTAPKKVAPKTAKPEKPTNEKPTSTNGPGERVRKKLFASLGDVAKATGYDRETVEQTAKELIYRKLGVTTLSAITAEQWKLVDAGMPSIIETVTKKLMPQEDVANAQ